MSLIILDKLEYINKRKDEEVFCEAVEEEGRIFAIEIANNLVTDDEIEAFKANLPTVDTPRKQLCVNRVEADISNALIMRDNYLEATQIGKKFVKTNGPSIIEKDNELSKVA